MTQSITSQVNLSSSEPLTNTADAVRPHRIAGNRHILYHLFTNFPEHLSKNDLVACSLVDRTWTSVATPVIWRNLTISLSNVSGLHAALITDKKRKRRVRRSVGGVDLLQYVRSISMNLEYSGAGWANFAEEPAVWKTFMRNMTALNGLLSMFGERLPTLDRVNIALQLRTGDICRKQHEQFQSQLDTLFTHHLSGVQRIHMAYNVPAADMLGKRVQGLENRLRSLALDGDWSAEEELITVLDTLVQPVPALQLMKCPISDPICRALVRSHGQSLEVLTISAFAPDLAGKERIVNMLAGCAVLKSCIWIES
ncbi:hypothetical protein DFJ77DRAFT_337678 [Powellomyces hirtus]|nr:hypothetical protein DFJ77DRAFT_337678 [Powellomyces hirtus]